MSISFPFKIHSSLEREKRMAQSAMKVLTLKIPIVAATNDGSPTKRSQPVSPALTFYLAWILFFPPTSP